MNISGNDHEEWFPNCKIIYTNKICASFWSAEAYWGVISNFADLSCVTLRREHLLFCHMCRYYRFSGWSDIQPHSELTANEMQHNLEVIVFGGDMLLLLLLGHHLCSCCSGVKIMDYPWSHPSCNETNSNICHKIRYLLGSPLCCFCAAVLETYWHNSARYCILQ